MSDLSRRNSRPPSRREREQRAQTLVKVGAGAGAAGVVAIVLGLVGVISYGPAVLLLVIAAICGLMFKRTVSG